MTPLLRHKRKSPRKIEGLEVERVRRIELPTLCLASIRSSQLSYTRSSLVPIPNRRACQFLTASGSRPLLPQKAKESQINLNPGPNGHHCGNHQEIHPRSIEVDSS